MTKTIGEIDERRLPAADDFLEGGNFAFEHAVDCDLVVGDGHRPGNRIPSTRVRQQLARGGCIIVDSRGEWRWGLRWERIWSEYLLEGKNYYDSTQGYDFII